MAKRTNNNVVERETGIQMPVPMNTTEKSSQKKTSGKKKKAPGGKNINKSDLKKKTVTKTVNNNMVTVKHNNDKKQDLKFKKEAWFVITFFLMLFMELSNFGACGVVGEVVSDFFFGVFGMVQYVMPVAFFVAVIFLIANQYNLLSIKKVAAGFIFLMLVSAFVQINSNDQNLTIMDLMSTAINNHLSGGIIGGGFGLYMKKWFGYYGALIVIICGVILSCIVLSQKSVIEFFKDVYQFLVSIVQDRKAEVSYDDQYDEVEYPYEYEYDEVPISKTEPDYDIPERPVESQKTRQKRKQKERMAARKVKETNSILEQITIQPDPDLQEYEDNIEETVSVTERIKEKHREKKERKANKRRAENCDNLLREMEDEVSKEWSSQPEQEVSSMFVHNDAIMRKNSVKELHANDFPFVEEEGDFKGVKPRKRLKHVDFSKDVTEEVMPEEIFETKVETEVPITREKVERRETPAAEAVVRKKRKKKKSEPKLTSRPQEFYEVEAAQGDDYLFPPISLLSQNTNKISADYDRQLRDTAQLLQNTLASFGVNVTITDISCGPSVTRYEMFPEQGTKVSKIVSLTDDIKLNLAAADVRIEAPIPGKAAIGIEVPNKESMTVHFRDLIESKSFRSFRSKLAFAVGKDIGGKTVVSDLAKMPHLLIAGATGSGKSVCINTLVMSILYKAKPSEVKLIMIDPKMVELSVYNGIPHLLIPVVTDPKKASGALNWAVAEMTDRYAKFTQCGVRNIAGYNQKIKDLEKLGEIEEGSMEFMPQIVIIVDELADLMMVAPGEVEDAIVRLSQLARAAGIHLVIATQRPSVNVITGLIKANVPSRIAFSVSSGVDSRTIIDMNGAEKLLGKGDMLFYPTGYQKPVRVQGAFVSDQEVAEVVEFLKSNEEVAVYDEEVKKNIESSMQVKMNSQDRDEYFEAAARFFIEKDKATIGMMQRMFKIGFNRAARIMDQLAEAGIVGPEEGTKPRKVLMSEEQLDQYFEEYL